MRFADIRSALIQSWLDGSFGLDTAYPNKKFDPAAGTPWAAVFILPNQPEVATLGGRGEDVHDGVFQISLFYPPDQGDADIMAKADAVAKHYKAGQRYTYDGQGVLIRSCGRSQGRLDDGWYRIDLTVNWQSHVSRAAPAPSCSVSLNADLAGIYGIDPFDTINAESATSGSTIQGAGIPTFDVTWSGERSIEFVVDQQNASGTFALHDGSTIPVATAENDRVTFIINGDDLGVEVLLNGASQATGTAGRSTDITVGFVNGNSSFADAGIMSFTAYPAAADIQNGRGSDWCGNTI